MNRARVIRVGAFALAAALTAGTMTACSPAGGDADADGDVTITWWHNATSDPLKGLWEDVATEFEADHPGVTVKVEGYQNEELQRTLIPNALRSGGGVDLLQAWGGGEIKDQVAAGYLMDISDSASDTIEAVGPTASGWQVDGKTYGLPFQYGIEGFWYNKDLFAQAGIDTPPTTLDELNDAVDALKAANIVPIAVGAGDKWPAAHYWYNFALKSCSPETLREAQSQLVFDDPCFEKAGELLQEFIGTEPFNEGYLATSAQQGAGSSAGLVATGGAAMELMGHWNPGVMGGILKDDTGAADATPPSFLGWFNFPGIEGADGDPTAALGGGDGFACAQWAPEECVELLEYIDSESVQRRFGEIGAGIPVLPAAADSITDPNLQQVLAGLDDASYVQLWLDTSYGSTVGGAMNDGIVALFGGQGTPEDIVTAMQNAAATL